MKKIVLILSLLVFAFSVNAQYPPSGLKQQLKNGLALGSKNRGEFTANDSLILTIDRNGKLLWRGNGTNGTWYTALDSANGGIGTVSSIATNNGTGINGGTITTSGTLAIDTLNISTRLFRIKGTDSLGGLIALKVNIADTANMLSTYQRILANYSTTYALSNDVRDSIQTKLALRDTSGMLSGYARTGNVPSLSGVVKYTDTASMLSPYTRVQRFADSLTNVQARIQTKLNISDTSSMLSPYARTSTGTVNYMPKFTNTTSIGNSVLQEVSGNLGLGVTPSAWGNTRQAIQLMSGTIGSNIANDALLFIQNAFNDGTSWKYVNNGFASRYYQNASGHFFDIAPSGTSGGNITFTQAMTLNASGNLLIGGITDNTNRVNVTGSGFFSTGLTTQRINATSAILNKDSVLITTTNVWLSSIDTATGRLQRFNRNSLLNVSDTATMLSNSLRISDTATMLSARPLNNRFLDTASALQTRIQTKSPIAGSSSIATVGTITSGTWNGGVIPILYGGTGSATQNFVDLTTTQASIGGVKTFTSVTVLTGATVNTNALRLNSYIRAASGGFIVNDNADANNNFIVSDNGNTRVMRGSLTVGSTVGTGTGNLFANNGTFAGTLAVTSTVTLSSLGTGSVQATAGVLSVVSDSRVKNKFGYYNNALNAISKLKAPQYWKYNEKSKLPIEAQEVSQFGLLADEVHKVLGEEFAPTNKDGLYSLSDRALLSLAIQAIQELKKEVDVLKTKIKNNF